MKCKTRRILSLILILGLLFQQVSFAQGAAELNIGNYLSRIGSNIVQDKFRPLHLRYFSYDSVNDNFKVLLDKGDLKNLGTQELQNSTKTLLNYFLVGVTLPNDTFWVNLRPDSEDQIIDPYLEKTDVGKIMLESDLQLKKDTAKFTSPESPEGREYWNKLYKKAEELFGYDNITIPTLTRPWIVPGEIIIREAQNSAYVYKATLKIMLEQDYLKDSAVYNFKDERSKALNEYSSQLIRELIIPKLTKEVNSSKRYAPLRQVYYSLILSRWFKLRFTGKTGTYASLINTKDLTNLISQESWSKTDYFKQYQKSFSEGEYNVKEPVYTPTGQVIRSYFSGGLNLASNAINTQNGIILANDNANKLGDVVGGKAIVDPQRISLQPAIVSSPIESEDIPENAIELPYVSYRIKPERELTERLAEEKAALEIIKELNSLIVDLRLAIDDYNIDTVDTRTGSLLSRQQDIINSMQMLYQEIPVAIREDREYSFYSDNLRQLRERRQELYQGIENADRANNIISLQGLNKEAIRNQRAILKLQLWVALQMLRGKTNLKHPVMQFGGALATLQGTLYSAQGYKEELHYRTQRLRAATIIQEIETADWIGDIVKTFRLGGFDVKIISDVGAETPQVTIRQQHWINAHTTLKNILRLVKKGDIAKALEKVDVLISLYNLRYIITTERYQNIVADLRSIRDTLRLLPETQSPSKSTIYAIASQIENLSTRIRHPKQPVWMDIAFKGLGAAFRSQIHKIASYEPEIITILKNKADLDYFVGKLNTATEKGYLSKRNRKIILEGIGEMAAWSARGFVYPKQFELLFLEAVQEFIDRNDFSGAQQYLEEKAIKELKKRIEAINSIIGNVKKLAAGLYAQFRDTDLEGRLNTVNEAFNSGNFEGAFEMISDLRELYFNGELVEPGYMRVESVLRKLSAMAHGAQRQRNTKNTIAIAQRVIAEAKEDVRHKYSFRINIVTEEGASLERFVNPGTTLLGLVRMLARDPSNTAVSLGRGWINADSLANIQLRDRSTVVLRRQNSSSPIESRVSLPARQKVEAPGGIDFRALPLTIQPMGSFSGLNFKLPQLSQAELRQINVDSEILQIKNMVQSGIVPSGQRIKELVAACIQKKEMNSQVDSLLLCLADIFKLEEENTIESSPELREALAIVDSQS